MNRPALITVIAIIAFVYAGLDVIGMIFALASMLGLVPANDLSRSMAADPVVTIFNLLGLAVSAISLLLLLVGGIGSLRVQPRGRTRLLVYARLTIFVAIVNGIWTFAYLWPKHLVPALKAGGGPAADIAKISGIVGGIIGVVFSFLFPAAILIVYNLRPVRDAFAGRGALLPQGFPPGTP